MDEIDKLKELRLIQYLDSLTITFIEESNESYFDKKTISTIKDTIFQLISTINTSPYLFFKQWSPFGFVIHYTVYYKSKKIFDITEKYLPKNYNRDKMNLLIMGEINSSKHYHFINEKPQKLSDIDY
jgi:hypothetical protein